MTGGCTVEMSYLLGGEVRQEGRVAGTEGLYGVSHSPLSRWRPEGGGWGLNVSGKIERAALQFGKGDGRMLQVVEQHLDLKERKNIINSTLIQIIEVVCVCSSIEVKNLENYSR